MFKSAKNRLLGVLAVVSAVISGTASAALPAVVGTEITAMQTDSLAAIDLVWPFIMAVMGGFVVIKIVKKAVGKAG